MVIWQLRWSMHHTRGSSSNIEINECKDEPMNNINTISIEHKHTQSHVALHQHQVNQIKSDAIILFKLSSFIYLVLLEFFLFLFWLFMINSWLLPYRYKTAEW
eukprot:279743_1